MRPSRIAFTLTVLGLFLAVAPPAPAADPRVTLKGARVVEGDAGTTKVRLALVLDRRARAGTRVRFRTRSGTAGAADFVARSGTLRFRRGRRRAVIVVRVRGDVAPEAQERFSVRLSKPRRLRLRGSRAVSITIVDDDAPSVDPPVAVDDAPVVVAAADVATTEPGAPGSVAPHGLAIALSRPSRQEVRVDFEIVGATTTAADVDLVRGTATFAPGETRRAIPGVIRGDALDEPDETATLLLANAVGAQLPDSQATLTIADDAEDGPPSLSAGDVTAPEADGTASVPVTLSAPSGRRISVAWATQDGTADAADHAAASGTLTIEPGATTAEIAVPITDDPRDEVAQTFRVTLAQPDGATLADADATVTIDDDDAPPTVSINDVTRLEQNIVATFTITLSAASEKSITMKASTVSSTAAGGSSCEAAGSDFVLLSNLSVTINAGDVSRSVGVSVCGDTINESDETASLILTELSNATAGDVSGLLTIQDND